MQGRKISISNVFFTEKQFFWDGKWSIMQKIEISSGNSKP